MCVCVCVCVRACVHVCVCMYKSGKSKQSKQCYNCNMYNTIFRIYLRNVTKFQKFVN